MLLPRAVVLVYPNLQEYLTHHFDRRHFWLSQLVGRDATGIYLIAARDVAKYPTVHRTVSVPPAPHPPKNYLAQKGSSVEVEKPTLPYNNPAMLV